MFVFSTVPGVAEISLYSHKHSIIAVLNAGADKLDYNLKRLCARVDSTTKCASPKQNIMFNGLQKYTNYTVEGWIVNGRDEEGARTTAVKATKPDSECEKLNDFMVS